MMIKLVKPFLFVFLSISMIFACVKEENEDAASVQERILRAYVEVNYPDAKLTKSGIYLVDSVPGTGASIGDSAYAFVRYSNRNLEGTYSSFTYESIAKQLGTYHETNFYGPQVWFVREDSLSTGLQEVMRMMKIGGKMKAIFPPWSLDEESGELIYAANGSSKIYEIELDTLALNIDYYQEDQLSDYANEYYNGLRALETGFYFKQTHHGEYTEAKDTIPDKETISVRYVGRFLDGTVFDTNVQDSAIKYNLIDPNGMNSEAFTITYYKDFEKAKEENESVDGFLKAVIEMGGYQDRCITFFNSDYGYGDMGRIQGNDGIPGFSQLFFEIWIDDEPN